MINWFRSKKKLIAELKLTKKENKLLKDQLEEKINTERVIGWGLGSIAIHGICSLFGLKNQACGRCYLKHKRRK